jgi:hypothetical protein
MCRIKTGDVDGENLSYRAKEGEWKVLGTQGTELAQQNILFSSKKLGFQRNE